MNDCQILEVSSDEQSSSLSNGKQTLKNEKLTAPPMPNFERSNVTVVDSTEFDCMMCCCQYGAHGEMASTPPQNNSTQICLNSGIWKKCLSSTYLYLYVIFMTFICIFLLIMEVLLDSRALQVTSTTSLTTTDETTKHLSAVLHWISFTIICMFLIETILRLAVWKIEVIRNPIALCDSAVIVCSFTVNLTTSLAAGIDSPWDAISLLIIFRFIRIYSLLQGNRREMKTNYSNQIQLLQVDLSSVQIANVKLQKQITDKDFEIKQLVAHLGGGSMELDEEIQRVVETSKLRATTTTTSDYEARLQQAIEQSKAEYGNGNGGFVNYSYTEKKDGGDTTDVIIHHRQNSVKRNLEEKPGTSKQFIDQHHTKDVGTSSSNDISNLIVNNKTSADDWNVGYMMINIVDQQPCNQPLPITDAASSSKKLVKINPKQLHKSDKMNEISRWIYKKEDDDDDSSDEGIESTPSSLKRKTKRFAGETHSISTTVATGDSGTLSDHGFSSIEVDIISAGSSPKTINNSFVEKSSTPTTITDNTNNCAVDDIELHEHTSLQQQNNNNTVSMV